MKRVWLFTKRNAVAIILAVVLSLVLWLPLTEGPPFTAVGHIETPEVAPGGELRIHYNLVRNALCLTTTYPSIIASDLIERRYPSTSQPAFGPIGPDERIIRYTLPENTPPGPARYRLIFQFECNWTQRIWPEVLVMPDLEFMVVAAPATP